MKSNVFTLSDSSLISGISIIIYMVLVLVIIVIVIKRKAWKRKGKFPLGMHDISVSISILAKYASVGPMSSLTLMCKTDVKADVHTYITYSR